MWSRWDFTVASLTKRASAMSRLVDPAATSRSTSISRSLNSSRSGLRTRSIRRAPTGGESTASPRAVAFTARSSSARGASFNRYPVAPASMAATTSRSVSYVVRTRTRAGSSRSTISRIADTPSIPGIRRSMRTTSGSSAAALSTASLPSAASPTTSKASSLANIPRKPSRTTGWSSTRSRRIGASGISHHPHDRQGHRDGGPSAGGGLHLEASVELFDACLHRPQPVAAVLRCVRREPPTVVADVDGDDVPDVREGDPHPGSLGVLGDVGERLLHRPQERDFDLGMEVHRVPGARPLDVDVVHSRPSLHDLAYRFRQRPALELERHCAPHCPPRLEEALPSQTGGVSEMPLQGGAVPDDVAGRLQLGDDSDEPLGDR